jgi:protein-disulfide isomerase
MSDSMAPKIGRFSWKSAFDVITSVVMLGAATFLVSSHLSSRGSSRPELEVPAEPVSIAGAANKGSVDARIVMIAFTDFQCPFCGRFAREVLPQLEHDYIATGRVQFVYRHLPLPIHQYALKAAQAAECARRQDQFWPMHDWLFARVWITDGADNRLNG